MSINLKNNYDKYGFAFKSVKRAFYEQWQEPYIEIKYLTNDKSKNINSYGCAFKDFKFSIKTNNSKKIIEELYNEIKNLNIFESTKYLIKKYPNNINKIIYDIPSLVIVDQEFYNFMINEIEKLPLKDQNEAQTIIKTRFEGIKKYTNNNLQENNTL